MLGKRKYILFKNENNKKINLMNFVEDRLFRKAKSNKNEPVLYLVKDGERRGELSYHGLRPVLKKNIQILNNSPKTPNPRPETPMSVELIWL